MHVYDPNMSGVFQRMIIQSRVGTRSYSAYEDSGAWSWGPCLRSKNSASTPGIKALKAGDHAVNQRLDRSKPGSPERSSAPRPSRWSQILVDSSGQGLSARASRRSGFRQLGRPRKERR